MVMWMSFAFLSAFASLSLMIYCKLSEKQRGLSSSPLQLILYLSFCDFFLSLNNGVGYALRLSRGGDTLDGFWCSLTFFLEHTAVITQILWYSMISLNILLILFGWKEAELRRLQIYQHVCIWGYAIGATIPPLVRNKYGPLPAAAYCYFASPTDWRRLLLYVPVTLGVIFALVIFIYTIFFFFVRRHVLKGRSILIRLGFLVVVFTFFWGSAAAGRLYDALGQVDQTNLQLIANTLCGTANFFVWTVTDNQLVTWVSSKFKGGDTIGLAHEATWETGWNTADRGIGSETEISMDDEGGSQTLPEDEYIPPDVNFTINSVSRSTSVDNQQGSLVEQSPLGSPPLLPRSRIDSL